MPAPCDSGATTSDASSSVVPGIRSARWLVTTKAICPWVSTAALERPVVPEVKKNQQGSSYSTLVSSMLAPACAAIASDTAFSPSTPSPIRQVKASAGLAASTAAAWSGKSPWQRKALAPEAVASQATSSGISLKLVGTQTAPSRKAENIDQNISSQFLEWTRMRSPLTMPRAASAAASIESRPWISRQVEDFSPQMKPTRSPCRRAFWVSRCARFITRRDIRVTPPDGAAVVRVAPISPSPHPDPRRQQHHADHARNDAVLIVHAGHAGLMSGKETRQLIRRDQEIDGGNHEQHNAEQSENELHGVSSLNLRKFSTSFPGRSQRVRLMGRCNDSSASGARYP